MREYLFILLLITSGVLIGQSHHKYCFKDSTKIDTEYGGILFYYTYGPNDHEDTTKITSISEYKNNVLDGRWVQFFNYPNDTASVEYWKNGKQNGPSFYKYKNGRLWVKEVYSNGILKKRECWTEEGEKATENITYDSIAHKYYLNGKPCEGKEITYSYYHSTEVEPVVSMYFDKGKLDSVYYFSKAYWGKDQEVWYNYIDSTRRYVVYYESGKPWLIGNAKLLKFSQNQIILDENEPYFTEQDSIISVNSQKEYYDNSENTLKEEYFYKNGLIEGDDKYYNQSGGLDSTRVYKNGKLIKTIKQ